MLSDILLIKREIYICVCVCDCCIYDKVLLCYHFILTYLMMYIVKHRKNNSIQWSGISPFVVPVSF